MTAPRFTPPPPAVVPRFTPRPPAAAPRFALAVAVVLAVVVPAVGGAGCGPRTVAAARICTPDARRCVDAGRVERCFGDGTLWIPYQTCSVGLTCTDGACTAPDADPEPEPDITDREIEERELPDLDAEYTNPCPGRDDMVWTGLWYCIDKYEAVLSPHADCRGDFIDGVDVPIPDGFPRCTGCEAIGTCIDRCTPADRADASTPLYACSKAGVIPAWKVTWWQARQACINAGKRLCRSEEFQIACSGRPEPLAYDRSTGRFFPYGYDYIEGACVDGGYQFWAWKTAKSKRERPERTDANPACVTPDGVLNLVGNVDEWGGDTNPMTWFAYGGGYDVPAIFWDIRYELNPRGSACTSSDAASTSFTDMAVYDRGFRCCFDNQGR